MDSDVFVDVEKWNLLSGLWKMTVCGVLGSIFYNAHVIISANGWLLPSFNNGLTYEVGTKIAIKCYLDTRKKIRDSS